MRLASKHDQIRRRLYDACLSIASLKIIIIPVFGLFLLVAHVLPLALIYTHLWTKWQDWLGHRVWSPGFPVPRTRFILLAIAIPMSTAVKALVIAIWPMLVWVVHRACGYVKKGRFVQAGLDLCGVRPAISDEYDLAPTDEYESDEESHSDGDYEYKPRRPLHDDMDVEASEQNSATGRKGRRMSSWATWLTFYTSVSVIGFAVLASYNLGYETTRWRDVLREAEKRPRKEGYGKGEHIFFAANFYNNAPILPNWTNQLARAIGYWGTDNIFISISESYSTDETPALLRALHKRLVAMNVEHRIIVNDKKIPRPPSMETKLPRIEFLSATRNRAIEPLTNPKLRRDHVRAATSKRASDSHSIEISDADVSIRKRDATADEMWYVHAPSNNVQGDGNGDGDGEVRQDGYFDRVLFSNDVFIEAEDFIELLETRDGDWDMVCGLDFQSTGLYDVWVTRDSLGRVLSTLHPFFASDAGMTESLAHKPVPVQACWNGVAAFRADPLLPVELRRGNNGTATGKGTASWHLSSEPLTHMPKSHPRHPANAHHHEAGIGFPSPALAPPLSFRGSSIDTGECFSSECFLLPYDSRRVFNMTSIWVNPRVVVAYEWDYYLYFRYVIGHWAVRWWITYVEAWDSVWKGWGSSWHNFMRRSEVGLDPRAPLQQQERPKPTLTRRDEDTEIGWSGRTIKGRERAMWHARGVGMTNWDGGQCQPISP